MSKEIFGRLLSLVLEANPNVPRSMREAELVPIEQTADGWFALNEEGMVVHVSDQGSARENITRRDQATALIGKLARRYPLATWFLPRFDEANVCPDCGGTGLLASLPEELRQKIACRCGGLGWMPRML